MHKTKRRTQHVSSEGEEDEEEVPMKRQKVGGSASAQRAQVRQQAQVSEGESEIPTGENEQQETGASGGVDAEGSGLGEMLPPGRFKSPKARLGFLRNLGRVLGGAYEAVVKMVVSMPVSSQSVIIIEILLTTQNMQESEEAALSSTPGRCFMWGWKGVHADEDLHSDAASLKQLHSWLEGAPHEDEAGNLVGKCALLQLVVGLGILLRDARVIDSDGWPDDTPDYVTGSIWDPSEQDRFLEYTTALQLALQDITVPRCVLYR